MITAFFISLLLSFANFSNSETFSPIPASDFSEIAIPQPSNLSVVDTLIFPGTICDTLFTGETAVWPITITNILDTANLLFEIDVDDEGGDFNESSVVSYSTSGASTVHTFSDVSPNIQQMYLQVVLNGDFDSPLERAEVWIEGIFFGSINDNDVPNGTDIIANFTIQNSTLDILLLDNVIEVLIQNTSTVGIANGNSDSHIVSLTSSSATWFSIDQNSGAVPDGESLTFNMTLDADKLFAGTYFFDMLIEFPDHPLDNQIVPVKLVVIGAPVFAATDTLIDFGTAFVNQPKFMDFEVTNEGTVALNFLSITTNNSTFLFNSGPFTLQPFESQTVTITFIAPDEESYNGSLLIATNEGNYFIELIGAGLHPPAIEVMPDSFCINLDAGEITTENVMITNTGSNMLEYSQFNYGGCTKNIIETFEDGAIQDFSVNNPGIYSFVFTPNDPAEGDFSLRIQGGNFVHYNGLSASLENCRPEHISFFVKSASQSTADGYFVLKNDLFEDVIFFFMSNDGTMGIFNSALETYKEQYEPHVWFFIEMKNFDFTNQQYDYYVDGQLIATNVGFRMPAENFSTLQIYNHSPSNSWFDDIRITNSNVQAEWLMLDTFPGNLSAGLTDTTQVVFNAQNLVEGVYESTISMMTNAPGNETVVIPVKLNVDGFEDIEVRDSIINLGNIFQGFEVLDTFWIINPGTANLEISGTDVQNPDITLDFISAVIEPYDSIQVPFSILSSSLGNTTDTIEIINNAQPQHVYISSNTLIAPVAAIAPDTVCFELLSNQSLDTNIVIQNTGGSLLEFNLINTESFIDRRVLVWEHGADAASELPNTYDAIAAFSPNLNISSTSTTDPLEFEIELVGKQVLIIPETETGSETVFTNMANIIQAFLQNGGTVIYCGVSDSQPYHHTGSFEVTDQGSTQEPLQMNINIPSHPLLQGVGLPIVAQNATGFLDVSNFNTTAVASFLNDPVILYKEIGAGKAIFIGYDFFQWDNNAARILSNAIHWHTISLPDWLTISPQTGSTQMDTTTNINLNINGADLVTGTYISNLTFVTNDPIHDTISATIKLSVLSPPQVEFVASPEFNCDGAIQFYSLSANEPSSWLWNFGNGDESTVENPFYIYPESGLYNVQLIACNLAGCDTLLQEQLVEIDYEYVFCDTVIMQHNTTAVIDQCSGVLYDDGGPDGNYSNGLFSLYTIEPPGASSITLYFLEFDLEDGFDILRIYDSNTTVNPIGTFTGTTLPNNGLPIQSTGGAVTLLFDPDNSFTRPGFKMLWECNQDLTYAGFSYDTSFHCGNEVQFINESVNYDSTFWDFGDGHTSMEENPIHTFGQAGEYTVQLIVLGSSAEINTQTITITAPAITVDFDFQNPVATDSLVEFQGISDQAISWHWDFDIGTDTIQNPTFNFTEMGAYPITLTVADQDSCTAWISDYLIVKDTLDAVQTIDDLSSFKLFPNPTSGQLYLEMEYQGWKSFDIQILNSLGQMIFAESIQGISSLQHELQLQHFPKGVYYLKMVDERGFVLGRKVLLE